MDTIGSDDTSKKREEKKRGEKMCIHCHCVKIAIAVRLRRAPVLLALVLYQGVFFATGSQIFSGSQSIYLLDFFHQRNNLFLKKRKDETVENKTHEKYE